MPIALQLCHHVSWKSAQFSLQPHSRYRQVLGRWLPSRSGMGAVVGIPRMAEPVLRCERYVQCERRGGLDLTHTITRGRVFAAIPRSASQMYLVWLIEQSRTLCSMAARRIKSRTSWSASSDDLRYTLSYLSAVSGFHSRSLRQPLNQYSRLASSLTFS